MALKFKVQNISQLYFPHQDWQCLRSQISDERDFFLWGCEVNGSLWTWTLDGRLLDTANNVLPILALESDGSELEALGLYLRTVSKFSKLQESEWVWALKTIKLDLSELQNLPKHWDKALENSGFKPHLGVLAQRSKFCFLTNIELKFLFDKNWSPDVFELLETLSTEVRAEFLNTIQKWNLSSSNTKESLGHLIVLSKKLGDSVALKLLQSSVSKSSEEFRQSLFQTSQPELANLSKQRIEKLRALHPPARTSVFSDPSFESEGLKITHTPKTAADFEVFKDWTSNPQTQSKITELLDIFI